MPIAVLRRLSCARRLPSAREEKQKPARLQSNKSRSGPRGAAVKSRGWTGAPLWSIHLIYSCMRDRVWLRLSSHDIPARDARKLLIRDRFVWNGLILIPMNNLVNAAGCQNTDLIVSLCSGWAGPGGLRWLCLCHRARGDFTFLHMWKEFIAGIPVRSAEHLRVAVPSEKCVTFVEKNSPNRRQSGASPPHCFSLQACRLNQVETAKKKTLSLSKRAHFSMCAHVFLGKVSHQRVKISTKKNRPDVDSFGGVLVNSR